MSHQIYYTSAPQGLKRGASGFCTVAASPNIPRPLWDRLESLSAYRHQFPASGSGQNPVSFVHSLLNVAGASYHVLSRICDSGVDHTQRTNAFAHHMVIEPAEMTPAGPAWMLQRGVMASAWDGQVGELPSPSLPTGDAAPAVCRAWNALAGDAGWGGHLADVFIKSPAKPVCILFSPGQEILPLLAESIALLPPLARWNVTFNTYFTSMPTSATCLWRCCLAGTPAAQIALRYAAAGIIIDLTDKARLGQAPAGPYAALARTGHAPAGTVKTVAASVRPAAGSSVRNPVRPPPIQGKPVDAPPESSEPSTYDTALEAANASAYAPPQAYPPATARPLVNRPSVHTMRQADAALLHAQSDADQAAARRRRQVMLLFASAILALAVGSALVFFLTRGTAAPDSLPTIASRPQPQPRVEIPPIVIATLPAVITPIAPPSPQPKTLDSQPAVAPVIVVGTAPAPVIPQFPTAITMAASLDLPAPGPGVADRVQTITFKGSDLEPGALSAVHLLFPNTKSEYPIKDSPAGAFITTTERQRGRVAITLKWKDAAETDLAVITFERARSIVEVQWKSAALVKRPDIVRLGYWVLQHSALELESRRAKNQQLVFKPLAPATFQFPDASADIPQAAALPPDTVATPPVTLPPGWQVTWYTDWDAKDAALRSPENASQVLKFHKPGTNAAVESWFLLTFRPGMTKVESSYAHRLAADEADLARAQSDLRAMEADIKRMREDAGIKETDERLKPYLAKKDELAKLADAYKAAVAGYKELSDFDVTLDLPGGLRLTSLHFRRDSK